MKKDLMSMNILVDSSGSMASIAEDMVGSLNQLVDENRDLDALVSYSIFSDEYQPVFTEKPIKEVRQFRLRPNGMTALIESACKMIDEVGQRLAARPEEQRPEKVMFVIVTDGHENHSAPQYTRDMLLEKIRHQTETYNWMFLYLGANQDAIDVARSYGIDAGKAMNYRSNDPEHVRKLGRTLAKKARQVHESLPRALENIVFDEEDRE